MDVTRGKYLGSGMGCKPSFLHRRWPVPIQSRVYAIFRLTSATARSKNSRAARSDPIAARLITILLLARKIENRNHNGVQVTEVLSKGRQKSLYASHSFPPLLPFSLAETRPRYSVEVHAWNVVAGGLHVTKGDCCVLSIKNREGCCCCCCCCYIRNMLKAAQRKDKFHDFVIL